MKRLIQGVLLGVFLSFTVLAAQAQADAPRVEVTDAWARPAVQGQMGTGAFMTLKARQPVRLLGAASAVAGVVEVHEMAMEGNVMRMRAVASLELPADTRVELKPGGYHVMLLDLKRPLKVGDRITVELRFETADKRRVSQPVEVEVRTRAPGQDAKH